MYRLIEGNHLPAAAEEARPVIYLNRTIISWCPCGARCFEVEGAGDGHFDGDGLLSVAVAERIPGRSGEEWCAFSIDAGQSAIGPDATCPGRDR